MIISIKIRENITQKKRLYQLFMIQPLIQTYKLINNYEINFDKYVYNLYQDVHHHY